MALVSCACLGASQSDSKPKDRSESILESALGRVGYESDQSFTSGDFPRTAMMLKVVMGINPADEDTMTNLIFMLRSIDDLEGALATAMNYRVQNPQNPDRGLAEAQMYFLWRNYPRIPAILEPDIARTSPAPHPNTFTMLGNAYGRMGLEKEALRIWELALKAHPGFERFVIMRDRSLKKLGL